MTKLFNKLFPGEGVTVEARRPEGKLGLVSKVEIPNRSGFTVVRRDIIRAGLKKKSGRAA